MSDESLSYRDAGVDIDAGNQLVNRIKPFAKSTMRPEVLNGLGGFGALFELPLDRYRNPVLVSGTDGVGTKLKLALETDRHQHIGIDLVAMCVNDLIVSGAEPLFFLDYYATGKLSVDQAADVIEGIAKGCRQAGCALVGGETAEMPGMYHNNEYDLAGFCVGIVEKAKIISGEKIKLGDALIALGSSGIHSNGYSLVRKILKMQQISLKMPFADRTIAEVLLEPTRIYVKSVLALVKKFDLHGISHITGGGFTENIPRILPQFTQAVIDLNCREMPAIFKWLQQQGNIALSEMLKTFNCGVGMVLIVDQKDKIPVIENLQALGETAWEIGRVAQSRLKTPTVSYVD